MPDTPLVILLFGPSCAGKSTVGRLAAGCLPKCAFIEVDALRYMVIGGLVAYSGGVHPSQAPDAYRQQCWMGVENAARLAHGFAAGGFSSVIDGLEEECRPGTGWSERAFGQLPVHSVGLLCDEDELVRRWQLRGWGNRPSRQVFEELEWCQTHQDRFDCIVDTTRTTPEECAAMICERYLSKIKRRV